MTRWSDRVHSIRGWATYCRRCEEPKTFAKENPALVIKGDTLWQGHLKSSRRTGNPARGCCCRFGLRRETPAGGVAVRSATVAGSHRDALRAKVEAEGPVEAAAPAAEDAPAAEEAPAAAADEAPEAPEAANRGTSPKTQHL